MQVFNTQSRYRSGDYAGSNSAIGVGSQSSLSAINLIELYSSFQNNREKSQAWSHYFCPSHRLYSSGKS